MRGRPRSSALRSATAAAGRSRGGLVALAHALAGDLEQADAVYADCIAALDGSQRVRSQLILRYNRALVGLGSRDVRQEFHAVRHGAEEHGARYLAAAALLGLALVEIGAGQETRARRWLTRAREVSPSDRLLALIDVHLAGQEPGQARSADERVVRRFLQGVLSDENAIWCHFRRGASSAFQHWLPTSREMSSKKPK